jgi:hypothetical protein
MTLVEALTALQLAGRIRSAWLPGMRLVGKYAEYPVRVTAFGERPFDTDDVAAEEPLRWWVESEARDGGPYKGPYLPDLADPATVGCFAALAREAWADPLLRTIRQFVNVGDEPSLCRWKVVRGSGWWMSSAGHHATEPEAWVAAIIAVAEAL